MTSRIPRVGFPLYDFAWDVPAPYVLVRSIRGHSSRLVGEASGPLNRDGGAFAVLTSVPLAEAVHFEFEHSPPHCLRDPSGLTWDGKSDSLACWVALSQLDREPSEGAPIVLLTGEVVTAGDDGFNHPSLKPVSNDPGVDDLVRKWAAVKKAAEDHNLASVLVLHRLDFEKLRSDEGRKTLLDKNLPDPTEIPLATLRTLLVSVPTGLAGACPVETKDLAELRSILGGRELGWGSDADYLSWYAGKASRCRPRDIVTRLAGFDLGEPGRGYEYVRPRVALMGMDGPGDTDAFTASLNVTATPRPIEDVVGYLERDTRPIVVLGEPGSGKTTALLDLGQRLAQLAIHSGGARALMPVYISLAGYGPRRAAEQPDVLRFVAESLAATLNGPADKVLGKLRTWQAEKRLVLLLDGMDEMSRGEGYQQRVHELSSFASRIEAPRCVFACRQSDLPLNFEHKRLLVSPFDRKQAEEFVARRFCFPLELGAGERIASACAFVDKLQRGVPGAADVASNPLMLTTVTEFVAHERRWPQSEIELYRTWLSAFTWRLREHHTEVTPRLPPEAVDSLVSQAVDNWEALAFDVARATGGSSAVKLSNLVDWAKQARPSATETVQWSVETGVRSGLLLVRGRKHGSRVWANLVFEDNDVLEFKHHRFQEFLAAFYLAKLKDAEGLDWAHVVDNPVWKEVLVYAIILGGDCSAAKEVLRTTLTEIQTVYEGLSARMAELKDSVERVRAEKSAVASRATRNGPYAAPTLDEHDRARYFELVAEQDRLEREALDASFSIDNDLERRYADRTVLAARIAGKLGKDSGEFGMLVSRVVGHMAGLGRPTSQIKMLRAWNSARELVGDDVIWTVARSPVLWVRQQSVAFFGRLADGDSLLADALLADSLSDDLWKNLQIHRAAAGGNPRRRRSVNRTVLVQGTAGVAMVTMAAILAWGVGRLATGQGAHIRWVPEWVPALGWLGIIGVAGLGTAILLPLNGAGSARRFLAVAAVASGALLIWRFPTNLDSADWLSGGSRALAAGAAMLLSAAAIRGISGLGAWTLHRVLGTENPARNVRRSHLPENTVAAVGVCATGIGLLLILLGIGGPWLLAPLDAIGAAAHWLAALVGSVWASWKVATGAVAVGLGSLTFLKLGARRWDDTATVVLVLTAAVGLSYGVARLIVLPVVEGIGAAIGLIAAIVPDWLGWVGAVPIIAILALFPIVVVLAVVHAWISRAATLVRERWPDAGRPCDFQTATEWLDRFARQDESDQLWLLGEGCLKRLRDVAGGADQTLRLLEGCEKQPAGEQARSRYWLVRARVEQEVQELGADERHGR